MTLCLPQPHISIMWIPVSGYTTAPLFLTIRYRVSSFPCVTKCQKKWRRFATLKIIRAQNTYYNTIAGKEKKFPFTWVTNDGKVENWKQQAHMQLRLKLITSHLFYYFPFFDVNNSHNAKTLCFSFFEFMTEVALNASLQCLPGWRQKLWKSLLLINLSQILWILFSLSILFSSNEFRLRNWQ